MNREEPARAMIVIRRLVDRQRAYTGIFLPGVPPKIFPTSDHEHARILQIYKQDRAYAGILNDFSEYGINAPTPSAAPAHAARKTKAPPKRG